MTKVHLWVQAMTESVVGGSPFQIGSKVETTDGRVVQIMSGQFWGEYGLSNFWHWQEVLPDGKLSEKDEHGYGHIDAKGRLIIQ